MRLTKLFNSPKFHIFIVPALFLFIGILTLKDYGISWDEQFHFNRGQAYLHYFLTGKKNFLDLPAYPPLRGTHDFFDRGGESDLYKNAIKSEKPPDPEYRRSYYLSDLYNFSFLTDGFDGGHPPASDILSALFNHIFYQKLNLLGDLEAYHLYEVFISSLLVLGVAVFTYRCFGKFAALVASTTLALYPLFFAENHFNIKDPPEAALFGLTIITFFFAAKGKNIKLFLLSGILAGLALGTKFNEDFLPDIVLPWFAVSVVKKEISLHKNKYTLLLFVLVTFTVFFVLWPFLWQDPWNNFLKVFDYYKKIGTEASGGLEEYSFYGLNTYPLVWLVLTTPVPTLFLTVVGLVFGIWGVIYKKNTMLLLVLLWFLIPIIRVSLPHTNIYGGVRQIIEFIPALAILAGIGARELAKKINPKLAITIIFLGFTFTTWELIQIHPNENVYFNQLIGGLPGAKEKNIPSWGNTYGNVYLQGVDWLNKNAPPDSRVGLPIGNMVNVPRTRLRPDIYFSNSYPSGPARRGEYVMEMTHDWPPEKWYGYRYYNEFLNPVYQVEVDEVPLLKIWKNDTGHTKAEFLKEKALKEFDSQVTKSELLIDLQNEYKLTRLTIEHGSESCTKQVGGYIQLSRDGINWTQEPETIDYPQTSQSWLGVDEKTFVYLFTAKTTRLVKLNTQMYNSCVLKNPTINISIIDES